MPAKAANYAIRRRVRDRHLVPAVRRPKTSLCRAIYPEGSGAYAQMSGVSRTAGLGSSDFAAQCRKGPVWGSCTASNPNLANDGNGPGATAKVQLERAFPPRRRRSASGPASAGRCCLSSAQPTASPHDRFESIDTKKNARSIYNYIGDLARSDAGKSQVIIGTSHAQAELRALAAADRSDAGHRGLCRMKG